MIQIYTDGSGTTSGPIGWAFVAKTDNYCTLTAYSGYLQEGTSNRAEIIAAIKALDWANPKHEVIVHTDSKYLMDGIEDWIHKWMKNGWKNSRGRKVANRDLWEELWTLTNKFESVIFKHVKGHSGNKFNELADQLAGEERRKCLSLHSTTDVQTADGPTP